jgi:hypothetical protein
MPGRARGIASRAPHDGGLFSNKGYKFHVIPGDVVLFRHPQNLVATPTRAQIDTHKSHPRLKRE